MNGIGKEAILVCFQKWKNNIYRLRTTAAGTCLWYATHHAHETN
jgi:hypothetical protein